MIRGRAGFTALMAGLTVLVASAGSMAEEARVPKPVVRTLDNGLRVAVFREPRHPIVQVQLLVDAGTAAEPSDAPGVAAFTAELLARGTTSRTAGALAVELDRLGASLEASAGRDYATLDGVFLARDLAAGLELMSDAALNPIFPEGELRSRQSRTLAALAQIHGNPAVVADEQLWSALLGNHPYGRPAAGSAGSVVKMSREKVQAFYLDRYQPQGATLAIAGDVDPDSAFAAAREWFGRWLNKSRGSDRRAAQPPPRSAAARIRIVDVPELGATQIRAGLLAPARGADDEAAFTIANLLLGGTSFSRLGRSPLGARGARSAYTIAKEAGVWSVAFAVPHDSAGTALARLRVEIQRFAAEPPAAQEVDDARRAAAAVFPMRFETLGGILGHWSSTTFIGAGADGERWLDRLGAVTPPVLHAVARRWLDAGRLTVVAVGPAAVLGPQLGQLGEVEVVRPGEETDPLASEPEPAPATPQQIEKGREVMKRALQAHGGQKRLERIQDSTVEATAFLVVGERELKGEFVQTRKEPGSMLYTTRFEGTTTIQGLHGGRGWIGSDTDTEPRELDSLGVAGMHSGFAADVLHLVRQAAAAPAPVSRGQETIEGRPAERIEVGTGAERRAFYFDAKDGRLVAMDQRESVGSASFLARRLYRDYRVVQGIPWPHVEERQLDGRRVMRIEVRRVAFNTGVRDEVFERPAPPTRTGR